MIITSSVLKLDCQENKLWDLLINTENISCNIFRKQEKLETNPVNWFVIN